MPELIFPVTNHVLIFTVITAVILLAPIVGAKLRVPDLALLLIAGTALGEHGFHILERNEAITLFGEVGLLYIMFLAGLEVDLYQFSRTRKKSLTFGIMTFLLPQVLGAMVVYMVLEDFTLSAAILMASLFASHTLLAYPVAARLGIHRSEPVTISVGATMITDTLALLVLAVIVDAKEGISLDAAFWGGLVVGMLLLVLGIALIIPRIARWFFQHAGESGGSQFLFVLAVMCACAYVSEFARMKPLIGAFLAGAAFNRQIPEHSTLMNRLEFIGKVLFIPFFLISVGMLVDPSELVHNPETWTVIGVMVGMVVVTKWLAAFVTGALYRYSFAERQVVFGLSVVQAAATLAAVQVGYQAEIFSDAVLNGAVAMILVTVPLGSAMVQRYGRKMALASEETPSLKRTEQRLLLAVRETGTADSLMDLGMLIRDSALPGGIFPVTIVPEDNDPERHVSRGEKLLANCVAKATSAEIDVEPHVRMDINPVDGLVRTARELRAGAVLTGWGDLSSRGSRLFGGVRSNLADRCPSRIYCFRQVKPLNTNKHLRLALPPLSEHRNDLRILFRDVKLLCKQAGLDLHVYVAGEAAEGLQKLMETTRPGVETRFVTHDTWKEARQELMQEMKDSDLLLLPQIRRDAALWTPTLDKLPELMERTFPNINLLVAYPAVRGATEDLGPVALPSTNDFPALRGVDLGEERDETRIEQLVRRGLPAQPVMAKEAVPLLVDSAKLTPVELSQDALLLHAHCGDKEEPILLIGHGESRGTFFDLEKTPRILVALLSPRGDAPELHLRSLARVAKRFRDPDVIAGLAAAQSAAEICSILSDTPDFRSDGPSAKGPESISS